MDFEIITSAPRLAEVCAYAATQSHVMLDTEFVRTRTLYPNLGLIQLFDGKHLALIDPIAIDDLSSFWALLRDQNVTKVLHACGEDLDVFLRHGNCLPVPMVDTQIMAAFLGHGLSTGFGALVSEYLHIDLEKGEARTDWLARPLTAKQLDYAADDVRYLKPLFECLQEKLAQTPWVSALEDECRRIMLKRHREQDPDKAYIDIKNASLLAPKQLALLQRLARWRIKEAKKRNLALNFVVKEHNLWKLAEGFFRTKGELARAGFERMEINHHGDRMLAMVVETERQDPASYPERISRLVDMDGYKGAVKALKEQVGKVEKDTQLAPEFLASKKQLHQALSWAWKHNFVETKRPEVLIGWRRPFFEDKLMPILKAK